MPATTANQAETGGTAVVESSLPWSSIIRTSIRSDCKAAVMKPEQPLANFVCEQTGGASPNAGWARNEFDAQIMIATNNPDRKGLISCMAGNETFPMIQIKLKAQITK